MNILLLRVIRITVFLILYFIASGLVLSLLKKRNPAAAKSDPEIIATSVIIAAAVTSAVSFIIKSLV